MEVCSFLQKFGLENSFFDVVCLCACSSFFPLGHYPSPVMISVEFAEIIIISLCFVATNMDSSMNQDKGNSASRPGAKLKEKVYNRYTPEQNQVLEEFYCGNPHPDASDRKQLTAALGLTDDRIKYWFQNRRALEKRKSDKFLKEQLKEKNDVMRIANERSKLTLVTATCDSNCMEHPEGNSSSDIEHVKLENACMKDMIDKMNKQLEKYSGIGRRYSSDVDDDSGGSHPPAEGPSI